MTQDQKSQEVASWERLKSNLPALSDLFANLDTGQTPNPIEMLAAISEMVAICIDCDTNPDQLTDFPQNMSQKKCRFCS